MTNKKIDFKLDLARLHILVNLLEFCHTTIGMHYEEVNGVSSSIYEMYFSSYNGVQALVVFYNHLILNNNKIEHTVHSCAAGKGYIKE